MTPADLGAWVALLGLGASLLLLPGLAVRGLLATWAGSADPRLGAPDGRLGALLDGLGLSLALWPLLLLYTGLLHIPFSTLTASAVLLVAALVLLGLAILRLRPPAGQARRPVAPAGRPRVTRLPAGLVPLALLTGAALVLRFIAVRGLVVPNWGDSFHHTLITQLFLEQYGVPHGYQPYAPVYSFTYHFGFHGLAALWAWLSGQPAWSAVLTIGQVLNALAVPAAYVLTRELFSSRAAALGSAVVVGFLSGMPAEYANWGRYTQLAGQVLLPFALVWMLRWLEAPAGFGGGRAAWPRLALAVLGAAGLGLTHYRVLIMYALFVLAYVAVREGGLLIRRRGAAALPQGGPTRWAQAGGLLGRALALGVLGGLLFAPWLGNLLADYLPGLVGRLGRVNPSYANEYTPQAFLTQYIGQALPLLALLGGLICLIAGPARARGMVVVLALWTGLLAISARPDAVGLPGLGAIGTFTIGIALYLPLGTLAGPGLARPLLALGRRLQRTNLRRRLPPWRPAQQGEPFLRGAPAVLALLAAAGLTLANPGARTVDPFYSYVTAHDLDVLAWVRSHTPVGARFLISAQSTYGGRAITAADAGMWLPLLAGGGRQTSVPPLSAAAEGAQAADFAARTQALYTASLTPTLPANVALLQREGIGYVFLGEHTATISPTLLLRDPADYCLLTRQGRSYLFGLGGTCPRK